jgi:cellulose synthase/poly-beta-1,6-N-acetylglucosamine synthase-like glycosyltransferase
LTPAEPAVSVVVPTRNRAASLEGCLAALAVLDPPAGGFETIVVDDGGDEPVGGLVGRWRDRLDLRLVRVSRRGPAAARNAGVERARAPLLAFTDDDCRPRRDWLRALAARLEWAPDALVGGRTVNGLPANAYAAASQLIVDVVYAHYNAEPERARFLASNNLAVRADALRAAGGFDAAFTTSEDRELCDRWRAAGGRILLAPEAVVEHAPPLTLGRFAAQHFGYGRGAHRFHRVRSRRGSGRFVDETKFHVRLPGLLRETGGTRAPRIAGLLVLWQAANAAGFLWEAAAALGRARAVCESENDSPGLRIGNAP